MARMGHASPRAALIYQHASADRDAAIAWRSPTLPLPTSRRSCCTSPTTH